MARHLRRLAGEDECWQRQRLRPQNFTLIGMGIGSAQASPTLFAAIALQTWISGTSLLYVEVANAERVFLYNIRIDMFF